MVQIAIAGGSGNVGQEIIDALIAAKKHDILLLSRKEAPAGEMTPGVTWVQTTYQDVAELTKVLEGVEIVLSFIADQSDPTAQTQKNLIDAAVRAGVKRFAPSEWATSGFANMSWYAAKATIRKYLEGLNKDAMVLEYCLFQPGLFTQYMVYPHKASKHVDVFETPINFNGRRAIMIDGADDDLITLTTAEDLAAVVVKAVEYEGQWPVVGGVKGTEISIKQLIALGEKIRGGPFKVERLNADDLRAGVVTSSWVPKVTHPSIPADQTEALANALLSGFLLGISSGNLNVSDEWNRLLPDYKFTQAEEFLTEAWRDLA